MRAIEEKIRQFRTIERFDLTPREIAEDILSGLGAVAFTAAFYLTLVAVFT